MTPLDRAFQAAEARSEDGAAQTQFYALFAETELFLLLDGEPESDRAKPVTVDPGTGPVALAFDLEDRLADFIGTVSPYLALSGRRVAAMLAEEGLGLALNLDTECETLLDRETLAWLAGIVPELTAESARPDAVYPPSDFPEDLLVALDRKLAQATGLAARAVLIQAGYSDGSRSHLLAVFEALPEAEAALATAVGEAMAFLGFGAGWLDVAFLETGSPLAEQIEKVGLAFEIPAPAAVEPRAPPGSDPEKPPILK
ncbi:MAG: SseB family protein [Pseudomonadota bacterium]